MRKLRELDCREKQNILKLKIDKIMADSTIKRDEQFPALGALNFFSSRSFSFTVPVRRKGFTDPFFRLLDSSNKSAKMS
jgi:hypothetical protein